jgi:TPR repeat protein
MSNVSDFELDAFLNVSVGRRHCVGLQGTAPTRAIGRVVIALFYLLLLTHPSPSSAGLGEEADAAYRKGDYTLAFRLARQAAEQGDVKAQTMLGYFYASGTGVTRNDTEAARWYRSAAEKGNAAAQYSLGQAYDTGRGVPQDYSQALSFYRLAAAQGKAAAQNKLGYMYSAGKGVSQDYAEAVRWYTLAAGRGDPDAQYNLGVAYSNGDGVSRDGALAAKYYKLSATQGNAPAQNMLGVSYANGDGVTQDYVQAKKWFGLAAEQGSVEAQRNLQIMNAVNVDLPTRGEQSTDEQLDNGSLAVAERTIAPRMSFSAAKEKCITLGFEKGTEKFGLCVLQITK